MARFEAFRTLRFRLTAWYVTVFAIVQVALWIAVHAVMTRYLDHRFDAELINRAQSISEAINATSHPTDIEGLKASVKAVLKPFEAHQVFLEIRFSDTDETVRSQNLHGLRLPAVEIHDSTVRAPHFQTLRGAIPEAINGMGDELRLVTLYVEPDSIPPFYLQVAAGLGPVRRAVDDIEDLLILFILVSLLVAGLTSWIGARRALAPLTTTVAHAHAFKGGNPQQLLPVPPGRDEVTEMVVAVNGILERQGRQLQSCQQFISHVGHELKTPLAVMLNEIRLHRGRAEGSEAERFLETLEDETRTMLRTVEGFLLLARLGGSNRLDVVWDVPVDEAILTAVHACTPAARELGIPLVPRLTIEEGAPEAIVSGDPDLLARMVENLLSNAIRYSPAGEAVEVEMRTTAREVEIIVRDSGPGIPEEILNEVFELFYQGRQEGHSPGKAGVGLALVKAVAEIHGGVVAVRNREAGGCEFTVRLPLVAAPRRI